MFVSKPPEDQLTYRRTKLLLELPKPSGPGRGRRHIKCHLPMRECSTNVYSRSGNCTRPGADFTLSGSLGSLYDTFWYCPVSKLHFGVFDYIYSDRGLTR